MIDLTALERRTSWAELGFFLALLVICLLPLSKNQPDPDFWGHVQYGQDVLREGFPQTATYTYNAVGHRWINHETLSELGLALGVQTIGSIGLLGVKCCLAALAFAAMMFLARRHGASQRTIVVVTLLTSINLMHFWLLRPQLSSYVLFVTLMLLLDWALPRGALLSFRCRDADGARWRAAGLWLVVPLFAVWANSHGGFVAGYALLVTYLVCRACELLYRDGRRATGTVIQLLAIALAAGLATSLNAAGWELHAWLWRSLGAPRPEIVEWRAPELTKIVWLPWWLLVALAVVSVVLSRKKRDPAHILLAALVLWQAVEHRRHIPFFALMFAIWLAPHVDDLFRRFRGNGELVPTGRQALSHWGKLFVAATAAMTLLASSLLYRQLTSMPVLRDRYPVSAFQFMADEGLHGKLVIRFRWAQYAISAFGGDSHAGPNMQVAFDGRFRTCYPQSVVDMYFDFAVGSDPEQDRFRSVESGPLDDERILDEGAPDLVLVDRSQSNPVNVLQRRTADWTLLYQDQLTQLFGRRSTYDDPASPDYFPPARRRITEQQQTGFVQWPALPRRPARERLAVSNNDHSTWPREVYP